MNLFAYRTFEDGIITWAARWYSKYGVSYRDLEEVMQERNIKAQERSVQESE